MSFKIWRSKLITPEYHVNAVKEAPPTFNLNQMGFPKLEIIKYGLKQSVVFYDRHDGENYLDPLCRVVWRTLFDGSQPKLRQKFTSWALNRGGWSIAHQSSQPIRNPEVFLQKMRSRVIEELIDLATNFDLADQIKSLYEEYANEIYIYKEAGSTKFRSAIAGKDLEWLDLPSTDGRTIRAVIVQYLSIGVVD